MGTRTIFAAALAGLVGGTLATIVQVMWWAAQGESTWRLLVRDSRLAAALLLGPAVLPPPETFAWPVMLAAGAVHVGVSVAYGVVLVPMLAARRLLPAAGIGILYGALVYAVNLHLFTALWPWFEVSRGAATLAAHLGYGASTAAMLVVLRRDAPTR